MNLIILSQKFTAINPAVACVQTHGLDWKGPNSAFKLERTAGINGTSPNYHNESIILAGYESVHLIKIQFILSISIKMKMKRHLPGKISAITVKLKQKRVLKLMLEKNPIALTIV